MAAPVEQARYCEEPFYQSGLNLDICRNGFAQAVVGLSVAVIFMVFPTLTRNTDILLLHLRTQELIDLLMVAIFFRFLFDGEERSEVLGISHCLRQFWFYGACQPQSIYMLRPRQRYGR